jgi:uncharacterized RDD family membrane protein YckC
MHVIALPPLGLTGSPHHFAIGKRAFGLKVVSKTSSNPTLAEAFIRNLSKIYWLLLLMDAIVGLALAKNYEQKYSDQFVGARVVSTKS